MSFIQEIVLGSTLTSPTYSVSFSFDGSILLVSNNAQNRAIAVSYTHLDVYKRQLLHLQCGKLHAMLLAEHVSKLHTWSKSCQ